MGISKLCARIDECDGSRIELGNALGVRFVKQAFNRSSIHGEVIRMDCLLGRIFAQELIRVIAIGNEASLVSDSVFGLCAP